MKDPTQHFLDKYAELLDGLIVDGKTVEMYDRVMGKALNYYILMDDVQILDLSDNDSFGNEVIVTLQVITLFRSQAGGKKLSNQISSKILETLYSNDLSSSEFQVYDTLLEDANFQESEHDTFYAIRKIISIRHLLKQT